MINVNETASFIDAHMASKRSEDPWFVYVALGAVHGPHSPPDHYLDGKRTSGRYQSRHMDMLLEMDRAVGSLVTMIEKRGLAKDTVIIFTSDNGGERKDMNNSTAFGHNSHGPLRGAKSDIYEGGHRVPVIFRYDRNFPIKETRSHRVGLNDLYRTLCDLAGVKVPLTSAQDSVSFDDYIFPKDNTKDLRKHLATWSYRGRDAEAESNRFGNMKFIRKFNEENTKELYDLENDLDEKKNLIQEKIFSELIIEMEKKLKGEGPCPEDHKGRFRLSNDKAKGKKDTCSFSKADKSRCKHGHYLTGETKCRSICDRHERFCRVQWIKGPTASLAKGLH